MLASNAVEEEAPTGGEVLAKKKVSPAVLREEMLRLQRKANLNKHGVIPEFIKIQDIYQVYTAFTQANLKNSILHQK